MFVCATGRNKAPPVDEDGAQGKNFISTNNFRRKNTSVYKKESRVFYEKGRSL